MCASAFPTGRSRNGSPRQGLTRGEPQAFQPSGDADAKLTVKLWLGRDRRILIADPVATAVAEGNSLMTQFRFSRRPDIGDRVRVSFEFFPPKTDEMEERLWETVTRLAAAPAAISSR